MLWEAFHIDREKNRANQYLVEAECEAHVPGVLREALEIPASDLIVLIKPCFVPLQYLSWRWVTQTVAKVL